MDWYSQIPKWENSWMGKIHPGFTKGDVIQFISACNLSGISILSMRV